MLPNLEELCILEYQCVLFKNSVVRFRIFTDMIIGKNIVSRPYALNSLKEPPHIYGSIVFIIGHVQSDISRV